MHQLHNYKQTRENLYTPIKQKGTFTWDYIHGDEYALATIHEVSSSFLTEVREATEQLGRIFTKTVQVVQQGSEELFTDLGFPEETWATLRLSVDPSIPTAIGRFDFAYTPQGLKMLEFNSDTPTGVVEAYHVNGQVCDFFGLKDPNQGMNQHLTSAFQSMIQRYQDLGYKTDHIVFTSLNWHVEDAGTTQYLMEQSGLHSSFIPLSSLAVNRDGLFRSVDKEYHPIDVLFRLHPLEIVAKEKAQSNHSIGAHFLYLVANRKVAIINPPQAFAAQSKAIQALIWNLYEQNIFFNAEQREIIATYMLPTYLDNPFHGKKAYVRKPFFGREGGAVTLYDQEGQAIAKDRNTNYWDQSMIYQEQVELETVEVPTLKGMFTGKLLWGSFLIEGRASALLARVDRNITGDMAYLLPTGCK